MNDYKFYAFYVGSKIGVSGITVTTDVYKSSDNSKVINNQSASGVGGGLYSYTYSSSSIDDYIAIFKTTASTVDQQEIPSLVVKQIPYIDTTISSRASGSSLDLVPTDTASASSVESIASISASEIWNYTTRTITSASVIMDTVVEGTYTVEDIFKITTAILAGKCSGGATTNITFRDLSDTLNRVISTVDASGNRSNIILDLS